MKKFEFKDAVVLNPQRKLLKIVEQNPNEIVADINYLQLQQQGTILNAQMLNEFQDTIEQNEINCTAAVSTAGTAQSIAQSALAGSDEAKGLAQESKNVASNAKTIAQQAQEKSDSAAILANAASENSANATAAANTAVAQATAATTKAEEAALAATNAQGKADCAVETSNSAIAKAENANAVATLANSSAQSAVQTATEANSKATEALSQVVEKQGTKVFVGDAYLANFYADSKVDVALSAANANKVLVTDAAGNVTPASEVPIGVCKCFTQTDAATGEVMLTFEFPEEAQL